MARMGEESVQGIGGKARRKDQGVDGITMHLRDTGWGSVEWIHLDQDRGRWRTFVNTVMNLRVWNHGVSLVIITRAPHWSLIRVRLIRCTLSNLIKDLH
jgi:hypothetical protein